MKNKALMLSMAILVSASITACGGGVSNKASDAPTSEVAEIETETELEDSSQIDSAMSVDALCVADDYRDSDNSSLRAVYLFYTLNAGEENLKADSKNTSLVINEKNTYESTGHSPQLCQFVKSYYYSDYLKDVYVGESQKVVATFYVPQGDLETGKSITLKDTSIPGIENIEMKTDDIQHFSTDEDIAKAIDPEGYNEEMNARTEAGSDVIDKANSYMVGYQWEFTVNSTYYEMEFFSGNKYELRTAFGTTTGKYVVTNGYIKAINDNTGAINWIPYTFKADDIDLDVVSGFDVKG